MSQYLSADDLRDGMPLLRAVVRIAIETVETAPGTDFGPENTPGQAFADILRNRLLDRLGTAETLHRLNELFEEEL